MKEWLHVEAPKGSKSPTKDNELSASGSRTSGHSALSQIHSGHDNKSVHSADGYGGVQFTTSTHSPVKLIKQSPTGSVHS